MVSYCCGEDKANFRFKCLCILFLVLMRNYSIQINEVPKTVIIFTFKIITNYSSLNYFYSFEWIHSKYAFQMKFHRFFHGNFINLQNLFYIDLLMLKFEPSSQTSILSNILEVSLAWKLYNVLVHILFGIQICTGAFIWIKIFCMWY